MRWSEQFVEGTLDVLQWLMENSQSIEQYYLVPSAVPNPGNRTDFREQLDRQRSRVALALRPEAEDAMQILDDVPESQSLKWKERILCLDESLDEEDAAVLEAYRNLATAICGLIDS